MSPIRPFDPVLSRSSSATSVSSASDADASAVIPRTRRRFTNVQLMMLEQLFHETSRPTRAEREKLAGDGEMEHRSVTIWFQNKRQTERKFALHNATNHSAVSHLNSSTSSFPRAALSSPLVRPAPTMHRRTVSASSLPTSSRLSLDTIAARTELRTPPRRTPRAPYGPLWDALPSSPLASGSPPALLEFSRARTRTLEWACAAERGRRVDRGGEESEEERDEAVTPSRSVERVEHARKRAEEGRKRETEAVAMEMEDEDVMRAALALCGLGRRRG